MNKVENYFLRGKDRYFANEFDKMINRYSLLIHVHVWYICSKSFWFLKAFFLALSKFKNENKTLSKQFQMLNHVYIYVMFFYTCISKGFVLK